MKPVPFAICSLLVAAMGCTPSTEVESPADPPGLEQEDEKAASSDAGPATEGAESEPEE